MWKRWRSEPIVLIVPPDHPLAEDRQISKRKLAELDLLGGEPGTGTGRLLESYFADGVSPPRIALQLGSTEAVKEAVKAGLGVSLVLRSAVAEEVRNGSRICSGIVGKSRKSREAARRASLSLRSAAIKEDPSMPRDRAGRIFAAKLGVILHNIAHQLLDRLLTDGAVL